MRRCLAGLVLLATLRALAGESASSASPTHPWPLWNGKESSSEYAKRVGLEPTQSIDLGDGVTMEFVLIPAGQFIMGTPEPAPVDEVLFKKQIVIGQALFAASVGSLLVMLGVVLIRAIRKRAWPQVSLRRLLVLTVVAGVGLFGGLHWRQNAQTLQTELLESQRAYVRFHEANDDEKPAHRVTLTKPFYMAKYEVTIEQYLQVRPNSIRHQRSLIPHWHASWDDAASYCGELSEKFRKNFRLPTEAEWEFACRAGTTTSYYSGDSVKDWERTTVSHPGFHNARGPYPVGQKEPNSFGLYDMYGNVWEWCSDWYRKDYYASSPSIDPTGPNSGEIRSDYAGPKRVTRGGGDGYEAKDCRSANREGLEQHEDIVPFGFRIVLDVGVPGPSSAP